MKKIINKIKDGLLLGLGFIIIVGIAQAWTGLQANKGDSLTVAKWNELVNKVETLEANGSIGVGQTWQEAEVTDSGATFLDGTFSYRAIGVTYTNNTGKPIMVLVRGVRDSSNQQTTLKINGITMFYSYTRTIGGYTADSISAIIPAGATYSLANATSIGDWFELR